VGVSKKGGCPGKLSRKKKGQGTRGRAEEGTVILEEIDSGGGQCRRPRKDSVHRGSEKKLSHRPSP